MENDTPYKMLKIGALLHDIGKWYKIISDENDNNKRHTYYGCAFVKNNGGGLKNYSSLKDGEKEVTEVKSLIKNHHHNETTNNYLLNILKISDILSNGELSHHKEDTSSEKYINLVSIFENISLNNTEEEKDTKKLKPYDDFHKYNIIPLSISNDLFPKDKNNSIQNCNMEEYNKYIDEVKKDGKKINNFENLLLFIQKYTWCIPSTYKRENDTGYFPDVSLYDHLKTTCAIACCLYNHFDSNNDKDNEVKKLLNELNILSNEVNTIKNKLNKEGKDLEHIDNKVKEKARDMLKNMDIIKNNTFSLIHGDISGVQDFIFNITSKGANKSLKGRSFYLDFLTELCAKYVANELKLPIANILFYGGGHFYILSHNIDNEKTVEFEEKINDILFEKFGADLYVAIGKVDLQHIDFLTDCMDEDAKIGIPYKWKESAEATSKRKMGKFAYKGMKLFEPKGSGDDTNRCSVCREENKIKDINEKKCIYCLDFEELTKMLNNFGKDKKIETKDITNLKIFDGFFKTPLNIKFKENNTYNLPKDGGKLNIPYKIWSIAFPLKEDENSEGSENKELMDFTELAEQAQKRTGTNKIAILKMDVDNLGKIITKGLGKHATLSRLSTLSSMLTLFFTGYIPYLIKNKYAQEVYLTYSGGDDTLIVGAWDKVWDLAKEINDEFRKFVCDNPDITLSAGVVLVNPKFEYRKGVYLAEDELDNAKDNKVKIGGKDVEKNSVSIFGHALRWDDIEKERDYEEKFIKAMNNTNKKRIVHLSQKVHSNLERALIKTQDENTENLAEEEKKEIITTFGINIPYLWRMKYYLYRNYKNNKNDTECDYVKFIDEYLNEIEEKIKSGKMDFDFNDIIIASRIAELKSRTEGNNELDRY